MEEDDDVVRPLRPERGSNGGPRRRQGGTPPRAPRRPRRGGGPRRSRRWMWILLAPALLLLFSAERLWVDYLWFGELGQVDVLVTRWKWSAAMGLATGLVTFAVLLVNFVVARRVARDDLYVPFLTAGVDPEAPDQPTVSHLQMRPVLLAASVLGGIFVGLVMSGRWETVLRFIGRTDFGIRDPHFGRDASFYVFTMPLLELVGNFLQAIVVLTFILVAIAYVAMGVIRYIPAPRVARAGIFHLSILVACFLVVSAFQYRLSIWNLVTSDRGVVTGAGWTDVHARLPGYYVLIVASLVLAGVIVAYARRERWRVVGTTVVVWVALSVLATGVVPSAVQKVLVEPNETQRETAVVEGNIKLTREGYGLTDVERRDFRDSRTLTEAQLLETNTATTDNIRLWSPDVLAQVLDQDQALRRYYAFKDVDVDRYEIDGRYTQVMLSVRELDGTKINPSWAQRRLFFTHGYGAVATWPNRVRKGGKPDLMLSDIPPKATGQETLELTRPEVYFGEEADNYAIVNSKTKEFDYPDGDDNRLTSYAGTGGIPISSFTRRLAFASTLGDPRILFTGQITPKSRLMFRRDIATRVHELAPFLELDGDPYAVIVDGGLQWVQDAYTTSDRFPYSQYTDLGDRRGRVNYVRNSVKAVIDAYSGEVTLYAVDEDDPILGSWREIFPDLFTPLGEMPDELRSHLRYPEDLFNLQTLTWNDYHVTNVQTFLASEDQWEVPVIGGQEMEPFYVLARLPSEDGGPAETKEELLLVRPLVPSGKKNMIAYMVARSDGEGYGQLLTLDLGKQSATQGPQQVQSLIKQDPEIAEQISLWSRGGNDPTFGNMLVLPIDGALLYAQPVYLKNAEATIPEFQKIVVVLGDDIAWGDDFEEAVRELLAKQAVGDDDDEPETAGASDPGTGSDAGAGPDAGGDDGPGTGAGSAPELDPAAFEGLTEEQLVSVLAEVSARYDTAVACQQRGDWACYGRELDAIEAALAAARGGAEPEG